MVKNGVRIEEESSSKKENNYLNKIFDINKIGFSVNNVNYNCYNQLNGFREVEW